MTKWLLIYQNYLQKPFFVLVHVYLNAKKWGLHRRRYIPATMAERQVESTDFLSDASPYISTINYALNIAIIFRFCARIASFFPHRYHRNKIFVQQLHLGKLKNVNITMLVFTNLIEKWFFTQPFALPLHAPVLFSLH